MLHARNTLVEDRFQTWVHPLSRLSNSRIWFDASLQLNDVSLDCKLCSASARCFNCITSVSLHSRATIFHVNHLLGCPFAWSCVCQEYATAIRRHEENSSHAACSKHPLEDRFQPWVHPLSRLSNSRIWFDASLQLNDVSLDCKLCSASARCVNNCITSVSLQSRATIFHAKHLMGCPSAWSCG